MASAVVLAAVTFGGMSASAVQSHGSHGKQHKSKQSSQSVTIYLTRHGQTILNTLERVQGWSDTPLVIGTNADGSALDGRVLPQTVGKNLRAREGKMDAVYSADMKRDHETAQYMVKGAKQSLSVSQDAALRELSFGRFEGAPNKEMWTAIVEHMGYQVDHDADATAPADENGQNGGWQTMQLIVVTEHGMNAMLTAMKEIAQEPEHSVSFPAEDCTDVNKRMVPALNKIAKKAVKAHDKRVLVVSSGLSITCVIDGLGTPVNGRSRTSR